MAFFDETKYREPKPEEFKSQFEDYMNGIKENLGKEHLLVGDAKDTGELILNKFNSLMEKNGFTPEGLLESRKGLDSWMKSIKSKVFNPATESAASVALRAIRQGGNEFLKTVAKDVPVGELLDHQSNLYDALDSLAGKAYKEGESGFERFVSAHPTVTKVLKAGAKAAGLGAGVHIVP